MNEVRLPEELRQLLDDAHHGWRQRAARGDAEALADIHERARQADATPEQLAEIAGLFTHIANGLVEQGPRRRRAALRRQVDRTRDLAPAQAAPILPSVSRAERRAPSIKPW